ncbi:MAG: peptide chain release factor N(5)-glutamine methyltransferase [Tannerellaceae bacterium]|jgi:release factor glutamine methyltransferase|nr:peptide chain release factor N(5)-glutamine methyltransferase [Tannerellaceae bacterium]
MTETIAYINHSLEDVYPPGEIRSLTRLILEQVCGLPPYLLPVSKDKELSKAQKDAVYRIVERLKRWEPIQYILGETTFCGLTFRLTPQVLIPRPETEEMVERILGDYAGQRPTVLDIGTGSGCIAVSLAHNLPGAQVTALDISGDALCIAAENARRNQTQVSFLQADVLAVGATTEAIAGRFDLIVANPPYVKASEKTCMQKNVLLYEPPPALYVSDRDPLVFYRAIARLSQKKLKENGALFVEINAQMGKETTLALKEAGFGSILLLRDITGKDRFITARR